MHMVVSKTVGVDMSIEILTREYTIVSCTVLKLAAPAPGAAHLNQHQELLLSCLRICALHIWKIISPPHVYAMVAKHC